MDGAGVVAAVGVVIGHFLEEEGGRGFRSWTCWTSGFKSVTTSPPFRSELGLSAGRRDGYRS